MLNYELALQLKNAGFKCEHQMDMDTGSWCVDCPYEKDTNKGFEDMCYPTLSELIEACGDDVILFHDKESNIWCAGNIGMYPNLCYGEYYIDEELHHLNRGENPEEAVAKLYLEINQK